MTIPHVTLAGALMNRIAITWQLMKDAWSVLMRDKELLLFPVASSVATFLVLVTFIIPFATTGLFRSAESESFFFYVVLFFYYLCNYFVIVYFNAGLVAHVVARLEGGDPTIRQSLAASTACLPQIAVWAIVSSTVGLFLNWLSERAGWLGAIASSIAGVAWTLVTYFVVPMIVIERKDALEAVGDSKDLLARTWGQQVVSALGFGVVGFLLALPAIVVLVGAILALLASRQYAAFGTLGVTAVLYLVALGIVMATLKSIFGAVLYQYARTGDAPKGFDARTLNAAIKPA